MFDATADGTRLRHRDGNVPERELARGSSATRATVSLRPAESIEIGSGAGTDFAGSRLPIAIEEPPRQAGHFANLELVRRVLTLAPGVI